MKIIGIEHIGIATKSIENNSPFWDLLLRDCHQFSEEVEEQKVNTKIYDTERGKIELLEATSDNSPIARFIEKRGNGIHHICIQVESIKDAITELVDSKVQMIDRQPRIGVEGYKIAFVHPKSTGGILVELAEKT
jgi:methylmalonyl-CoA epimerase